METFAFTGELFVFCLVRPFFYSNALLSVVLYSPAWMIRFAHVFRTNKQVEDLNNSPARVY